MEGRLSSCVRHEVLPPSSGLETNRHEARSENCGCVAVFFLEDGGSILLLMPMDCIARTCGNSASQAPETSLAGW
jgi:hypothetical protein